MQQRWRSAFLDRAVLVALVATVVGATACAPEQREKAPEGGAALKVLSVCELFAGLESHQNQIVSVRGIYDGSLREFNCPQPFVADGRTWPTVLYLRDAHEVLGDEQRVPFNTDRYNWDRLDETAIEVGLERRKAEIWVTVEGLLRGPRRFPGGRPGGIGGYGHLGAFPASLVVNKIHDVTVASNPTIDYGRLFQPRRPRPADAKAPAKMPTSLRTEMP